MTGPRPSRRRFMLASAAAVALAGAATGADASAGPLQHDACVALARRYHTLYVRLDVVCRAEDAQQIAKQGGAPENPDLVARCEWLRQRINDALDAVLSALIEADATTPAGAIAKLRVFAEHEADSDLVTSAIADLVRWPGGLLLPPPVVSPALATLQNARAAVLARVEGLGDRISDATLNALGDQWRELEARMMAQPTRTLADALVKLDVLDSDGYGCVAMAAEGGDWAAQQRIAVMRDLKRISAGAPA